ncbi:MAG: hypothetical protein ACFB2Z_08180 [Maricaulaceae bacterium]
MSAQVFRALAVVALAALGGCASPSEPEARGRLAAGSVLQDVSEPRREIINERAEPTDNRLETQIVRTPGQPSARIQLQRGALANPPPITGESVSGAFENMNLASFVNATLGELLGLPFEIDTDVANRRELVTMRAPDPISPQEFFSLVQATLEAYGVSIFETEGLYRVVAREAYLNEAPSFIEGRADPATPADLRPIAVRRALRASTPNEVQEFLKIFTPRTNLRTLPASNSVLLIGTREDVTQALDLLDTFDTARFAGRPGARIRPVFWEVDELRSSLIELLSAEGYEVRSTSSTSRALTMLAFDQINTLMAFADDEALIDRVVYWVRELDTPASRGREERLFFYVARNMVAGELASLAGAAITGSAAGLAGDPAGVGDFVDGVGVNVAVGGINPGVQGGGGTSVAGPFIVDENANQLIFRGTANEYAAVLPLLERLDRAPKEVLIELTVVDVTLSGESELGFEAILGDAGGNTTATFGTLGGLGLGGGGLGLVLSRGDVQLALNALATRSKINVLSNPRIVTRSAQNAFIQVGSDVPVVTGQAATDLGGGPGAFDNVLQSVQFRRTGVLLNVTPRVHGDRVELVINQEVSGAEPNPNPAIVNPEITNRTIQTTLSLQDGQTAVLGGLISESVSRGSNRVPGLGSIPVLGRLFRTDTETKSRSELVVFVTPYILDTREEFDTFTRTLIDRINLYDDAEPFPIPSGIPDVEDTFPTLRRLPPEGGGQAAGAED